MELLWCANMKIASVEKLTMAECIHFPDDPNAVCSLCTPRKPVVNAWDAVPCEAKYPGTCVDCDGTIYIGDVIVKGRDGWAHENCRARG